MGNSNPCYSGQKQIAKENIVLHEEQSLDPDNAAHYSYIQMAQTKLTTNTCPYRGQFIGEFEIL